MLRIGWEVGGVALAAFAGSGGGEIAERGVEALQSVEFRTTGVGVAVDKAETAYFTRLFVAPPDPSQKSRND